ncbi:DUF4249 domain-containing protein [Pontibacter lucknowensis]|uniref:DUF4249 domain-containing protein n=1 Tax=Pontibacter lucknowensis TaxID=1077936 RepID=A0A1N7B9P7_9BACT|nr:DUF4249 domain-containing protein [Pontibacter lucknowensis]SIR48012.1 protein of unknown function [Pontibacter lucknowensis]
MLRKIFPVLFLLLAACIDPIDFKHDDQQEHLVVESSFTNMAGINYVRLTYALPYNYPYNKFEENASVVVTSQEGEQFYFSYDQAGYYYPIGVENTFGIPGHTYTLQINVGDNSYRSEAITLKEPVPISQVHFAINERSFALQGDRERKRHMGYQVLMDFQDPGQVRNYYRWSFARQYEVLTQPWDFLNDMGDPAPKDCCARCWIQEKEETFTVSDDRLTNGRQVINKEVLFIPFEKYLQTRYKMKVYQHAITADAYEFYRIMGQQKESTGTVFDPPPAEIKGNMRSTSDPGEQVLGFFDVSGVVMQEVDIRADDIPYPVGIFIHPDDCRELPGATNVQPVGW